ncbi:hypothetical protein [Segetibacter aerophilus]|uniref:Uncharacterized protein n=1 Tax=Segetibacter aerophilus TaxID=670293 RepID=A0A512BBT9_9BACT|nr:hypothetical protein [Segetibacter aerophilus]GEO09394.1 hypothetical protein SAE01_18900 [Segetibacter aerophilus]
MVELPAHITYSTILTDEDKNKLSAVMELPTVAPSFYDSQLKSIFQYYSLTPDEMDTEVHKYASKLLAEGKVNEAWQVLLTSE